MDSVGPGQSSIRLLLGYNQRIRRSQLTRDSSFLTIGFCRLKLAPVTLYRCFEALQARSVPCFFLIVAD